MGDDSDTWTAVPRGSVESSWCWFGRERSWWSEMGTEVVPRVSCGSIVGCRQVAKVHTGPGIHPASCAVGTGSFPGA